MKNSSIVAALFIIICFHAVSVYAQDDDLTNCKAAAKSGDATSEKNYCLRAANAGNIEAIKHVAKVYEDSRDFGKSWMVSGSASDFPYWFEAAKWYSKAGDLGDVDSQYTLCEWYNGEGAGVGITHSDGRKESSKPEVNYSKAFAWCNKAANSGHDKAQLKVARMLEKGSGVPQNYEEAMHWYLASAEQGNINAMLALAYRYDAGRVITQNHRESTKWFQRAANLGNLYAQIGMGQHYHYGLGVTKNKVLAHMWLNLAASQQVRNIGWSVEKGTLYDEDARQAIEAAVDLRNQLEKSMTAKEVRDAQRMAREWKPK